MILLIDNYDSFTFNLAQLIARVAGPGVELRVVRNDERSPDELWSWGPSHVVISPGPGDPSRAGVSGALIAAGRAPVLGVCLGHQCIAAAWGARVERAPEPVHGRAWAVRHDGRGIFTGVGNPMVAARYHSLVVARSTVPEALEVCAETEEGVVMALRHRERPVVGVQFHPESVLTREGDALVRNFLEGRVLK
nr:aminodeoxychorismate/anthranilate synthase component II [Deltaproteobacteria bacterium]